MYERFTLGQTWRQTATLMVQYSNLASISKRETTHQGKDKQNGND